MPGFEVIGEEEKQAIDEIFAHGGILYRYGFDAKRNGVYKVTEFEELFAKKLNARYAQAVSSGTAALQTALHALGISKGDEVITQSHTFVATPEAILALHATPVITQINHTLNMDPSDLESKITEKTRAIIPVHMLGVAAELDEIISIAKKYNIPILEDSCQALGGSYKGRALGTIGRLGVFSFDFAKTITTGEGGMIVTDDEALFLKARGYQDHGHDQNLNFKRGEDTHATWGLNFRMMEIQGALGVTQLKKLDTIIDRQKKNKKKIKDGLKQTINVKWRELPDEEGDSGDALIFFVESKEKARAVAGLLAKAGIGTKNLPDALNWHFAETWDHMLKELPYYKGRDLKEVFKASGDILHTAIALPIYVNMSDRDMQKIIDTVSEIIQRV